MNNAKSIIQDTLVAHTAFKQAQQRLDVLFQSAADHSGAEGLAIVGESGTGKTSVLDTFAMNHRATRTKDGMHVPILRATVPSGPNAKNLAGAMLNGLYCSDSYRGTQDDKTHQLKALIKNTGTRMIMIDEFQYFYDRGTERIMHHVDDWLKGLMDDTRVAIVVAGLPSCQYVINQNEQLGRRFHAPLTLPRFSWTNSSERLEFTAILDGFNDRIATVYESPQLHSDSMAFRFYCATGGLIAYVAKILLHTLRCADAEGRTKLVLADFDAAEKTALWLSGWKPGMVRPFEHGFEVGNELSALFHAASIGQAVETIPAHIARKSKTVRKVSAHSVVRAS